MNNPSVDSLRPGQSALISRIDAEEAVQQRLLALGFRHGKRVELIRRGSFSGPLHLRIGTTEVIMRPSEAQRIKISA